MPSGVASRPRSDLPASGSEPPSVPDSARAAWEAHVLPSRIQKRARAGLRWWLNGYSWAECAAIMGEKDASCAAWRKIAKRCGLYDVMSRTDRILGQSRRIAFKAGEELEARLDTNPSAFQVKELGVTRGIEIDKIASHEGWRNKGAEETGGYLGALTDLAEKLNAGESISLELKVSKDSPDHLPESTLIDVTPPEKDE